MLRYEPHRSEFAAAGKAERIFLLIVSTLCVLGALLLFLEDDGTSISGRWFAAAVLAIAVVPFVPTRGWRWASALAAVILMVVAVAAK